MPIHIIVKDTRFKQEVRIVIYKLDYISLYGFFLSKTMDMTIDQQVALDEALVPYASRLRIGKSNFFLRSDITSKESTLQLVYDVLRQTPFYKAFLVTTDVPEIYMLEFWATATVHHNSICFKMDNRKRIINLEYYREINKVSWHYVRDDQMFTIIKLVSRHQNTQQFGVMLLVKLTNKDIKNSKAYKEYYAVASGVAPPKTKASVRKTKSSFDTQITPPTATSTRPLIFAKGKQPAKASKEKSLTVLSEVAMTDAEQIKLATKRSLQQNHISQASGSGADEGAGIIPGVPDVPTKESDEKISLKSSDEDDDDVDERSDDQDEGNDDDQDTDNEGDEFVHPKLSIHEEEETKDEESFDAIVQTPKNLDDEGNDDAGLGMNVGSEEGHDAKDDEDELYRDVNINLERDVQMTDVHTTQEFKDTHVTLNSRIDSLFETYSQMDVPAPTTMASLSLTTPTLTPPTIPTISRVTQAPTLPTTAPSTLLQDLPNFGSLFGFDHRLKTLEANFAEFMQTNQFAGAISSIPWIVQRYMDQRTNEEVKIAIIKEQVKEQVKTSYAVTADLLEMELNNILIEKMERNKSIHRSNEQRNLYKALVEDYESDKIILDTYGDTVTLKRHRDDANKDEEPFTGSDRGSKRRREGKEPESTSAAKEKATKTTCKSTQGSKSQQKTKSDDLAKQVDYPSSFNELMDTPGSYKSLVELEFFLEEVYKATIDQLDWNNLEGQQYLYNLLKPLPLIPNSRGRCIIPFDHFINNDLEYLRGSAFSPKYTTSITKTKAADYGHINWIEDFFYRFAVNRESTQDVYFKCKIIAVIELQIVGWHNYKHFDWIMICRDDDKLYKFKEDLQLGVESYQKKLNLTKPDTYRSDLKRKESYTAYFNPRGFIYRNKDKENRLMRIHELHNFSDGTLNYVRTALDYRLKGIRMKYLPQAIWRKCDNKRAAVMIHAIDKHLKTRRIMRSLEKFIGDGASWSIVVEEGEPVDAASTGATTSAIGAMTSRANRSTLGGRLSCDSLALVDGFTPVEDNIGIVKIDKVNHIMETDIVKLVVEIKSFGMSSDDFYKKTGSSDGLQPKQADLSSVHALSKLHLHEIHVVPRTKWVYRNKLDENGGVSYNKARLVAQGYNQQKGIDYDETYALVAKLESIRIILAYAYALDFKLFPMDVKSAILNSFINEEVYMAQPPGFIDFKKPDHISKLKKALYCLKQAPKDWYDRLKAFLIKHEYNMGIVDNKLFTKKKSLNLIIVQIYVNDIIFGSTCQHMCDDFAKIMHDEFEMSMMGELNFFIGLQIKQMEDNIFFSQSKYIKEMLKKFSLEESKPMKTPMSLDMKLMIEEEYELVDSTKYRGMIGSLLYLTTSRPDIMFILFLCARNPKTSHLEAVKHIF
uniref:Retrovirus-related Pol polyprotein from transposon TNT 1-94 n=1 Tax=Tanacetum cinerariifolium TaxID=118510 RepID=A0A6L2MEE3_TANCI|nr:retrovirus-related Pol polyprotein from transposon TNT 1-94 [Tanacetum cinerariifolium]